MVSCHLTCYIRVLTEESSLTFFQVIDIVDLTPMLRENKIQNKQTTIKTKHADIPIKLSKLKENILTYTKITKLSNSLCKLSANGRLNLTN